MKNAPATRRVALWLAILLLFLFGHSYAQDMKNFSFHVDSSAGNGTTGDITGLTLVGVTINGSSGADRSIIFEVADNIGAFTAVKCTNIDTRAVVSVLTISGTTSHRFQCPVGGFKKFRIRITGGSNGTISAVGLGLAKAYNLPTGDGGGAGFAPVTSIFGRVGDVIAQSGDYSIAQIVDGASLTAPNVFTSPSGQTMRQLLLSGSTSGTLTLSAAPTSGNSSIKFPSGILDFTSTGGPSNVLRQQSLGGAITVGRLSLADLSDASTVCTTEGNCPGGGPGGNILPGAGLTQSGSTFNVASTEANFLTNGGATSLDPSAPGRMQVMADGRLQYTDGASTPLLRSGYTVTPLGPVGTLQASGGAQDLIAYSGSNCNNTTTDVMVGISPIGTAQCRTPPLTNPAHVLTDRSEAGFPNAVSLGGLGSGVLVDTVNAGVGTVTTTPMPSGALVGTTATQQLTNKGIVDRNLPVSNTATSVQVDLNSTDIITIANLQQALTITDPIGSASPGQLIRFEVCSSTSQTLSWSSQWTAEAGFSLPTSTTGGGYCDLLRFEYSGTTGHFPLLYNSRYLSRLCSTTLPPGNYTNSNITVNASGCLSAISNGTPGGGTGTATPAGTDKDVQFNEAAALAADSGNFTYDPASKTLSFANSANSQGGNYIEFNDTTGQTGVLLAPPVLSAPRGWQLPDEDGQLCVKGGSCGGPGGGNVNVSGTPSAGQVAEWTNVNTIQGVGTTGSSSYVRSTSPTLVTPNLGTPSAAVLTNATGLPLDTGVVNKLPYANFVASTAASKLVGRGSTSAGDFQEITIGTNLSMSGTTLNASAGAGGYTIIQEEGSGLNSRSTLNFIGGSVTCADNAGAARTDCTFASPTGLPDTAGNGIVVRNSATPTTVNRSIAGTSPVAVANGDGVAGNPTISVGDAAANGTTKGISTYNATDFSASSGLISLNYASGQTATTSQNGFLSLGDWNAFSGKQNALVNSAGLAAALNDETGTGLAVFSNSPTIVTPTIASFANATHNHTNAAGGGQLTDAALSSPVGVAKGGTNLTASADDNIMIGNGTTWQSKALPPCVDSSGNHLNYDASTNTLSCGTSVPTPTNALADGTTKGVATFNSNDFETAVAGVVTIDYANAQAATGSQKGFLTNVDWTTFNNKVGTATTDTLTNKTLDVEATGNQITTVSKIWLPAAGCQGTTAGLMWDTPAANAASAACVSGTNTVKGVADFADGSNLSMQTFTVLPSDWTGAIDAKIKWFSPGTSGSAQWFLATACVGDGETDDPTFNTTSSVTDATKATPNQTNDAIITGLTVTGVSACNAGEIMHLRLSRDATSGNVTDNLNDTGRVLGVELTVRRTQ